MGVVRVQGQRFHIFVVRSKGGSASSEETLTIQFEQSTPVNESAFEKHVSGSRDCDPVHFS